ncbi:MAG TPA: glycosyltransferase family 4 protein [Thermoanaerobaculia bacterium]|nr:glycosyltransferase family 4 protein [Thermoanaerobaculia bacterium]
MASAPCHGRERPRLAVVVSHPIQYFVAWHRAVHRLGEIRQRVFFCSRRGLDRYFDPGFGSQLRWDIPLLGGYEHEFLDPPRIRARGRLDNPTVCEFLSRFEPRYLLIFGYAHPTNWRALRWARSNGARTLMFADSNARTPTPRWKGIAKRIVLNPFYRRLDGALYVSDAAYGYHRHYGLPPERLFPCPFPIDIERMRRAAPDREGARGEIRERHSIPRDAFLALHVGKYQPYKRQLDLLSAAIRLRQQGHDVWCLLVGDGPDRERIARFIADRALDWAILTGFVNQAEIPHYYASADVLVLPSTREAYGLSATEALACGLPLVVSDRVGCLGGSARPGVNAFVHRAGDPCDLAAQLERLILEPATRQRMSSASWEIAESQTPERAARALVEALDQVESKARTG